MEDALPAVRGWLTGLQQDITQACVDIDGQSQVMTVTLKDVDNRDLWSVDIEPRPDARAERTLARHF